MYFKGTHLTSDYLKLEHSTPHPQNCYLFAINVYLSQFVP